MSNKVYKTIFLLFVFYIAMIIVFSFMKSPWYINYKRKPIGSFGVRSVNQRPLHQKKNPLCLNGHFENILLVVNFNFPFYTSIPILKSLYMTMFPSIVFYGTAEPPEYGKTVDIEVFDTHKGFFSYAALSHAMRKYPNYTGYLLINDDVLLNPWTLYQYDQNKIWEGPKWPVTIGNFSAFEHWYWWESRWGLKSCITAKNNRYFLPPHLARQLHDINKNQTFQNNSTYKHNEINLVQQLHEDDNSTDSKQDKMKDQINGCSRGRADVFYVPRTFSEIFIALSDIFHKNKVFLEIAVPTILRMIMPSHQFQTMGGIYLPGRINATTVRNASYLWKHYDEEIDFIHPVKLNYHDDASRENRETLKNVIMKKFERYTKC